MNPPVSSLYSPLAAFFSPKLNSPSHPPSPPSPPSLQSLRPSSCSPPSSPPSSSLTSPLSPPLPPRPQHLAHPPSPLLPVSAPLHLHSLSSLGLSTSPAHRHPLLPPDPPVSASPSDASSYYSPSSVASLTYPCSVPLPPSPYPSILSSSGAPPPAPALRCPPSHLLPPAQPHPTPSLPGPLSFEKLLVSGRAVFENIIQSLAYADFRALYLALNLHTRFVIESAYHGFRSFVLERYLGRFGYRTLILDHPLPRPSRGHPNDSLSTSATKNCHRPPKVPDIGFKELDGLYFGVERFGITQDSDLIDFIKGLGTRAHDRRGQHPHHMHQGSSSLSSPLSKDPRDKKDQARLVKAVKEYLRSYNKLVIYLRILQEHSNATSSRTLTRGSKTNHQRSNTVRGVQEGQDETVELVKRGRGICLKVWVDCMDYWMSNAELIECERELWRSEVWSNLRRGDVCWNLAIGDFANEGRVIFDGCYLRDLGYELDEIGHLPAWLNMMEFPASYYHKLITNSESSRYMIVYLDLSRYKEEIIKNVKLVQDLVNMSSAVVRYRVQKWVYLTHFVVGPPPPPSKAGAQTASVPVPVSVPVPTCPIDQSWHGRCVIEIESTTEKLKEVMGMVSWKEQLSPWKIVREKSWLGRLWLRPVYREDWIQE